MNMDIQKLLAEVVIVLDVSEASVDEAIEVVSVMRGLDENQKRELTEAFAAM
jgi:hypothetical protein